MDYEQKDSFSKKISAQLLKRYRAELKKCDVVLLSDYAKGMFDAAQLRTYIALARKAKKPVLIDPKPSDAAYASSIRGASVLFPNRAEAHILAGSASSDMNRIGRAIAKKSQSNVLLTLGADGALLVHKSGKVTAFPSHASGVIDVSGAGDTVAAALSLAYATGASLTDCVDIAVRAAGVVVGKRGTATVTGDELLHSL
jgi:D-beta-D-heptose 7-phosphate kinase/D-beta-D-heptose 1-phosphate adenosyltransferase